MTYKMGYAFLKEQLGVNGMDHTGTKDKTIANREEQSRARV
jgi:hypothetical protein